MSDNLALPYRDESFDAVLSIAVIHHIATTERRVRAIRELARILRYNFTGREPGEYLQLCMLFLSPC